MMEEPGRSLGELEERVYGGITSTVRSSQLDGKGQRRLLDEAMGALVDAQEQLEAAGDDAHRRAQVVAEAHARLDAVERELG